MLANRVWTFAGALSLLLGLVWTGVWFELILPLSLSNAFNNLLLTLFIASYCMQMMQLFFIRAKALRKKTAAVSFFIMGLFSQLFFAAIIKDIFILVSGMAMHEKQFSWFFLILTIVLNLWGMRMARHSLHIKHVIVPIGKEHTELNGFKIVQISDLHTGPQLGKNYSQKVVAMANQQNADLIVLTGDIGDSHVQEYGYLIEPFRNLQAKHGIFYITGNHEYYWNAHEWIELMRLHGIQPLLNEGTALLNNSLWLGGVTDPDGPHFIPAHKPDAVQAIKGAPDNAYKVLLAHQPKNCFAAEKAGFDLMLSGHTHGGQFFPFNYLVGFFNPHARGLSQQGPMTVYVNQGAGFWGPALRLGVPAEITLLELRAK